MRIDPYQCQSAQDLVFLYTKRYETDLKRWNVQNLKRNKGSRNPLYSYTGLKVYRIENDIKNSITRIHSVDDRTFPCHKAKALDLRLCCF